VRAFLHFPIGREGAWLVLPEAARADEAEFKCPTSKVLTAQGKGLPVLKEGFLDAAIAAGDWKR
jgi:hypothetical protein